MRENATQTRFANVGMSLIHNKVAVLLCVLVITGIFGYGVTQLSLNNATHTFLPDESPAVLATEAFEEIFHQRDIVFILVESDHVFNYQTLEYLQRVSADLEANFPFATDVVSLANVPYMESIGDMLVIDDLIQGTVPKDPEALAAIRQKVMSRPSLVDTLVTADEKATGIIILMENLPTNVYADVPRGFATTDQAKWAPEDVLLAGDLHLSPGPGLTEIDNAPNLLAPAVNAILHRNATEGITAIAIGGHLMDFHGDVMLVDTAGVLVLATLAISALLMVFLTRGIRPVIGSFLVIVFTLIIVMGSLGWLGLSVNAVGAFIPVVLVMVISVGYSIHVVNHFKHGIEQGWSRLQAIRYAYAEGSWPILVSAFTSAIGFISFMLVPLPPIRIVGMVCAIGSLVTYVMVMVFVPMVLSLGKDVPLMQVKTTAKRKDTRFAQAMVSWANFVSLRPVAIIVIAALFMAVMGYNMLSVRTNPDLMEMAGDGTDWIRDTRYVVERLGSLYTYDVFIEFPDPDTARTSQALQGIEQLQRAVDGMIGTVNTSSLVNLLAEMNMVMNDNDVEHYRVPDSDNLVAQYLLLYEMAGGDALDGLVDFEYQQTRLSVQLSEFSNEVLESFDEIRAIASHVLPVGTQVSVVGEIPLLLEALDFLAAGNVRSLFTAVLFITLVMMLVLKSIPLGLLSMIPNALPIVTAIGFMALTDITLDFFTVMVTPMILGIAVDDTVHYFVHFKEEFDHTGCYVDANRENFRKIGRALIFTTIILVAGFAVLTMIPLKGFQNMAFVAALGISIALIGDMLLAPALTIAFKPFGRERAPTQKLIKEV